MNIASFYTQNLGQQTGATTPASPLGANASAQELDFFEFLLARLAEGAGKKDEKDQGILQSDNPLLAKTPKLDVPALADTAEIGEEVEEFSDICDPQAAIEQTLALNQQAFDQLITPLNSKITTDGKDANASANIQQMLDKIQKLTRNFGPDTSATFDVSNLTPSQITDLKAKLQDMLNAQDSQDTENSTNEQKDNMRTLAAFFIGLIGLVPQPPASVETALAIHATPAKSIDIDETTEPTDDLAAQLNELSLGGDAQDADKSAADSDDFKKALKSFVTNKEAATVSHQNKALDSSVLQNWSHLTPGTLFTPAGWNNSMMEQYGLHGETSSPVTSLSNFINPVTQTQSAAAPLPVMSMITATVKKAIATGEAKNITLQLDPPELGRVEVRMNFGKDRTLKTSVIAEKQETFNMLQRDSHQLERALQDAGISVDNGGLSFELAHEGYDFNKGDQNSGNGSTAAGGVDADEIIQSSMSWYVDPDSGHMRYNILA